MKESNSLQREQAVEPEGSDGNSISASVEEITRAVGDKKKKLKGEKNRDYGEDGFEGIVW